VFRPPLVLLLLVLGVWPSCAHAGETFRTARYDRGEWIFTNGLHQALGANTDGLHRTDYFSAIAVPGDPTGDTNDLSKVLTYNFFGVGRAARNGDFLLPTNTARWPDGTADLAQTRLRIEGDELVVEFVWNAMPRPDAQIATIAFAPADGAIPASRPWPRGAGVSSPWTTAVTVWGTGAVLTDRDGRERNLAATTGDHVTQTRVPLAALPSGSWRLTGGSGLTDPSTAGQYWSVPPGPAGDSMPGGGAAGGPAVWDLLFADDIPWSFDERAQADLLLHGDVGAAHETVDPTLLRSGATRPPPARTGDLSRQFVSRLHDGDGIDKVPGLDSTTAPPELAAVAPHTGGFETWTYHGRLQDYAMHVPARYDGSRRKWPLLLYLHGFGGNPDEAFYLPLGLVARADKEGYVVASLRGRGDLFYTGAGELDVLEVLRDIEADYAIDRDRVYLMGHSMGGYGTNNVATHHPDLFAAVAPMEGTSSLDLSDNLRNVPWFEVSADEDLDAGGADATALYEKLSASGLDATLLIYHVKIHEYSSIYDTLDEIFEFFGAHRRTRDPAVVSWTRRPDDDQPKLGLVHDGAYWLHGVQAADAAAAATVTARSFAIGHRESDPAKAKRTHDDVDTGGPSGRTTAQRFRTVPHAGPLVPRANRLIVDAANTEALMVNAGRARLRLGRRALVVAVHADHALRLTLTGLGKRSVRRRLDGGRAVRTRTRAGRLTLTVPAGHHTVSLRRLRARR
jgi:predicted esterase